VDRDSGAFVAPSLDEPMHAVVGAVISAPAQFFEQGRAALPLRQLGFLSMISVRTSTQSPSFGVG